MAKETIEIDVPDGWEIVNSIAYRPSPFGEQNIKVLLAKKKPKRRVFEESLTKRKAQHGELYTTEFGTVDRWRHFNSSECEYTILTEIKEENDQSN